MRNALNHGNRLRSYVSSHANVSVSSLDRLFRHPATTLMTAAVIAIALSLPAGLYIALDNISKLSSNWGGSTQISLFLHTNVNKSDAENLMRRLEQNRDIHKIELINKKQGLQQFSETSGFGDALKYLEHNPLPIVLLVQPDITENQPDKTSRLVERLGKNALVELAQLDAQWVKRLYTLLQIVERSIWVISATLAIAVLLVIGNTIRLDIQNRKQEIEVSKLIGASDRFIRRPFLYTGLWYGLIGGIVAWVITFISLLLIEDPVNTLALLYHSDFRLSGLGLGDTVLLILISGALGLIGSWVAVSWQLNEIEPN